MLMVVTASHRSAAFDFLDRLSDSSSTLTAPQLVDGDLVRGAVVVSTCNRVEAYVDVHDGADAVVAEQVIRCIAAALDEHVDEVRPRFDAAVGEEALRHLFAVTSGLESVAVGEEEIAGQVKRAYQEAHAAGTTTPELDRAFQRAAQVSRHVREQSALGGAGRSLVQLALDLAGSRVQDWRATRVLVLGTGRYAAITIAALRQRGVTALSVYSATGRAHRFAASSGSQVAHDLTAALADADVVVTCTARYVVRAVDLIEAGDTFIVDLGMPRNVDLDVRSLPGVEVLDLELIARHASVPDLVPDATARALVGKAVATFTAAQTAAPAVVALRGHVFDLLDAELARVTAQADPVTGLVSVADATAALRHLAGVLLHRPSERARILAARGDLAEFEAGLVSVFGLDAMADTGATVSVLPQALHETDAADTAVG